MFDYGSIVPQFKMPELPDLPTQHMWADSQFEILKKYITEFEAGLDDEHEVGVMLTNFGQGHLCRVRL